MSAATQHMLKMNNGGMMPALGFGTWQAAPNIVYEATKIAIAKGFRHIDCATLYQNEEEVGRAIEESIRDGVVKREDLFVVTKLWNTEHEPSRVERNIRESLAKLRVAYVDMYLMHYPVAQVPPANGTYESDADFFPKTATGGCALLDIPVAATWAAMEDLVDAGLAKTIGVSNFSAADLDALHKTWRIAPVTNQVELHPSLQQPELIAKHKELNIVTTAYCPLALGFDGSAQPINPMKDEAVIALAKRAGVSPAQLLLRWNLVQGNSVLSKSINAERIAENAATPVGGLPADVEQELTAWGRAHPFRSVNPPFAADGGKFFPPCA